MYVNQREKQCWIEFLAIAAVENGLDKAENMLRGLGLPRNHVFWLIWEAESERNTRALALLMQRIDLLGDPNFSWLDE